MDILKPVLYLGKILGVFYFNLNGTECIYDYLWSMPVVFSYIFLIYFSFNVDKIEYSNESNMNSFGDVLTRVGNCINMILLVSYNFFMRRYIGKGLYDLGNFDKILMNRKDVLKKIFLCFFLIAVLFLQDSVTFGFYMVNFTYSYYLEYMLPVYVHIFYLMFVSLLLEVTRDFFRKINRSICALEIWEIKKIHCLVRRHLVLTKIILHLNFVLSFPIILFLILIFEMCTTYAYYAFYCIQDFIQQNPIVWELSIMCYVWCILFFCFVYYIIRIWTAVRDEVRFFPLSYV